MRALISERRSAAHASALQAELLSARAQLQELAASAGSRDAAAPEIDDINATVGAWARALLFPHPAYANAARRLWRMRGLDWHNLVPAAMPLLSAAEAPARVQRLRRDAAKAQLLALLQGYADVRSDVSAAAAAALAPAIPSEPLLPRSPSANHGPLAQYAACGVLRDPCMIHLTVRACVEDELCGWCGGGEGLCVDRFSPLAPEPEARVRVPVCASGALAVVAGSIPEVFRARAPAAGVFALAPPHSGEGPPSLRAERNLSNCSVVVTRRRALILGLTGNSVMAYHFWMESAPKWFSAASHGGGLLELRQHVWTWGLGSFLSLAHLFTPSCARALRELPEGVRVCYAQESSAPAGLGEPELAMVSHATGRRLREGGEERAAGGLQELREGGESQKLRAEGEHAPLPVASGEPPLHLELPSLEPLQLAVSRGFRVGLVTQSRLLTDGLEGAPGTLPARAAARLLARGWARAGGASFTYFMLRALGLWDVPPRHRSRDARGRRRRPLVVLVSRLEKRFILNEPEVVRALQAAAAGGLEVDVEVATLETMPLFEQLAMLRRASVLVGIHGSALVNSMHMSAGCAVLQVVPRGLPGAASFFQPVASAAGVAYWEVRAGGSSGASSEPIRHFHFLGAGANKSAVMKRGAVAGDAQFFAFWINADVWVGVEELVRVVRQAVEGLG